MYRFLFAVLMILSFSYCFGEENVYSISMLGQKIGESSEKWEVVHHKDGKCLIKLNTHSSMKIKRGTETMNITTESMVSAECKTFKPLLIKTETKESSSSVSGSGMIKENIFYAEITKNNNKEKFSYPIENGLTFFSMILKKHSPAELIKGLKKTVISEESLNKVDVSFSGEKKGDSYYIVQVNYSGIPINFHINNGVIIRSELQNGLITYELIKSSRVKTEKLLSNIKKDEQKDVIQLSSKTNSGIFVKNPRKTKSTLFEIKGISLPEIPSTCYQKVKTKGKTKEIEVNKEVLPCVEESIENQYLLPNIFEDSNSPSIMKTAEKLKKGTKNKKELIKKTILFVFRHIKNKNYSHGNLSASETLKKRTGDCTEHSTLLSALLKALKIPVKMVYGVVLDDKGNFFFHNWNEVYTDKGWMPVDSTFGMVSTDSSRIVLAYGGSDSISREQVAVMVIRFLSNDLEISVNGFSYE